MTTTDSAMSVTLAAREAVIDRGLASFLSVGEALAGIRDDRQYRDAGFDTFEAYCRERWNLSRTRAYSLIGAADMVDELSRMRDTPLPLNARQAEALTGLDTEAAAVVMTEAHAVTNGKPTAKVIQETRKRLTEPDVADPEADDEPALTAEECAALDDEFYDADDEEEPPTEPVPEPLPRPVPEPPTPKPPTRKSLPDAFGTASFTLTRDVAVLQKLSEDNRLRKHKDQIAQSNLHDLIRARDALQCVIDKLT